MTWHERWTDETPIYWQTITDFTEQPEPAADTSWVRFQHIGWPPADRVTLVICIVCLFVVVACALGLAAIL